MPKIKFGFTIPVDQVNNSNRKTFVDDLNKTLDLISGHFDSFWIIDHLQSGEEDLLESFTTLSYMAALHPQFKFGHIVVCQAFRNPALLAKMGATLQFLTGGRFTLGIGAGWNEDEYRAYGYSFPSRGERVEQLEETLQIVRALWKESKATFNGKHYQISDAYCEPKPNPVPPIMIGAFRPKMLRLTAQYADEWNVSSMGPNEYRRLVQDFEHAFDQTDRDPSTVQRSWCGGCSCASTQAKAERIANGRFSVDNEDDFGFVGTPEQVVQQMRLFIALGVNTFILDFNGFPNFSAVELLVSEVLPAFNK